MNFVNKILLSIKKKKVIVILKEEGSDISEIIFSIFKNYIKSEKVFLPINKNNLLKFLKNNVVLFEIDNENKNLKELGFLIKKSSFPVLILEKEITGNDFEKINFILKKMNKKGRVIVDYKNDRKINFGELKSFKIGFGEDSDLWATDLNFSENSNFKINHQGDVIPFWLEKKINQEKVKRILFAVASAMFFGINLIEISQNLKKTDCPGFK